jgi:hypothetical protein
MDWGRSWLLFLPQGARDLNFMADKLAQPNRLAGHMPELIFYHLR